MATEYAIKPGYVTRARPRYFTDADRGIVHQPDVLDYAASLTTEHRTLIDVGCGQARKLGPREGWRLIGIDYGANIAWCRAHHDWGEWVEIDLDQPHVLPDVRGVVVCADVIEHLRCPEHLLSAVRRTANRAVFTTPERDLTWGRDHNGPPPNFAHVREWNRPEFGALLAQHGFTVEHLGLTRTDDAGTGYKTILAVVS